MNEGMVYIYQLNFKEFEDIKIGNNMERSLLVREK